MDFPIGDPAKRSNATVGTRRVWTLPLVKAGFQRRRSSKSCLIHVDGTLQNPETRREALPGVNRALQQLKGELQNRK